MNLKNMLLTRCPKCGKGQMFISKNPYSVGKITEMHQNCPSCQLKFEAEPGFFYGAMYVSYVFNIALFVIGVGVFYSGLVHLTAGQFFFWFVGVVALLFPLIFRVSRAIWLHMNYKGK